MEEIRVSSWAELQEQVFADSWQPELRRFKSGWGAREEPLAYTWIGNAPRPGGSRPFEAALAVLIRNSSPWVCRAMGELFYRYAA